MASSSSSPLRKFDVFLSFRGEDTRKGFVSHLYKELVRMGIRTFRDDEELRKGKSIFSDLQQAIRESKFAVVVISRNYASSSWCLDELHEIVKCEENGSLTIVPVFYEVDPSAVKKQSGPFAKSFGRHKKNPKVNPEKLQRWKEALTKVATKAGEDSRNWKEDSVLIEKLVAEISIRLVSTTSSDFSDLVGMEDKMRALSALLDLETTNEVCMIGIWGMPGIGKSTLARYVYDTIAHHFEAHCFMEDVKKLYRDLGPVRLQQELLFKLLGGALTLKSSEVGSNVIKARLGNRKVLIVIDDVDAIGQLDVLAKNTSWFGPGSRIVVTTQNQHLLLRHQVKHVYKVECLNSDKALQLFSLYAFKCKQPLESFADFSIRATKYAEGLPLALKVLGSFLFGRSKKEWEGIFRGLEGSLTKGIKEVLEVSYKGLDEQEKYIFLLVACLFDGERLEDVSRILSDDHNEAESRIQTLIEKSLIDKSNGSIRMHGLLQKMGRELARGRILTVPKEISDALTNNEVNKEIEGISLDMSLIRKKKLPIVDGGFGKISNLKFLKVYNHGVNDGSAVRLASSISLGDCKLKYLSWDAHPLRTLQFRLDNLVVLELRASKLEKLPEGSQPLNCLKRIDLRHSENLREIRDLSWAPNLEYLDVSYCKSLIKVSSIKGLNKLAEFRLIGCSELVGLPSNVNLRSLQVLWLAGCEKLKSFPQISQTIKRLNVTLSSITELPDSIDNMSYLVKLEIYKCKRLKTLPSTLGNLRSLEFMKLEGCEKLGSFPNTIEKLVSLTEFDVVGGHKIREFPLLPPNIEVLVLTGTSIKEVPPWIGNLSKLRRMDLQDNRRLKDLPASVSKLKCLEHLVLGGCSSMENLPAELCETMSPIRHLDLCGTGIKELPDNLGNLRALQTLYVGKISRGKGALSIMNSRSLSGLRVCQDFYKPDGEPYPYPLSINCSSLGTLRLRNLNMQDIPSDFGDCFPRLVQLDLTGNNFQTLPASIKHLTSLTYLNLNNCKNLRSLPEISSTVKMIYAHGCVSLETASEALNCSVHILILSGCIRLRQAPDLAQSLASRDGGRERYLRACLPLSQVPRWFKDQAKGPSLTIHLPRRKSVSDISGFVACIVVAVQGHYDINGLEIECAYYFRDSHGHIVYQNTMSYHIGRFRYERMDVKSGQLLFLCKASIERHRLGEDVSQDVLFSFNLRRPGEDISARLKVKECGVRLWFQQDVDERCDGDASTNRTSDEETGTSKRKQKQRSWRPPRLSRRGSKLL